MARTKGGSGDNSTRQRTAQGCLAPHSSEWLRASPNANQPTQHAPRQALPGSTKQMAH